MRPRREPVRARAGADPIGKDLGPRTCIRQDQEKTMRCASDPFDWNDENVRRLQTLWAEGHSTAEIGRRMGVTKNAIVGKAHRLNLPARPSPIRAEAERKPRQLRRAPRVTLPGLQAPPTRTK